MEKIGVVSPVGVQVMDQKAAAPRLKDLNGKTVGEIWNGVFKGDETFPAQNRWGQKPMGSTLYFIATTDGVNALLYSRMLSDYYKVKR